MILSMANCLKSWSERTLIGKQVTEATMDLANCIGGDCAAAQAANDEEAD
jgi:hypothetical protein